MYEYLLNLNQKHSNYQFHKSYILDVIFNMHNIIIKIQKTKLIMLEFEKNQKNLSAMGYNEEMLIQTLESKHPNNVYIEIKKKIYLSEQFTNICLHDGYLSNIASITAKHKQGLINYKIKNIEEKNIVDFFLNKIKTPDYLKLHPLILLHEIKISIEKKEYKTAANIIIQNRNVFFGVENQLFLKNLILLQMLVMRYCFQLNYLHILSFLLFIDFSKNIEDNNFKSKFLNMSGISAVVCGFFYDGIQFFQKAYELDVSFKKKAKSAFLLGVLNEYLFLVYNDNQFLEQSKKWLLKSMKEGNCSWSLLAMSSLNKKPKIQSIKNITLSSGSKEANENIFLAQDSLSKNQILKSINHIYSLKKQDFHEFSSIMKDALYYFIQHPNKASLFRFSLLYFKYTGNIIKEMYLIPDYIAESIRSNIITITEGCELMGIISEESKFLDHHYYNLDKKYGLGIYQVNPTEIVKFCQKMHIPYFKKVFLQNKILQTKIAVAVLRHHKKLVNNSFFFSIFYYVCGHESYILKRNTEYLCHQYPIFKMAMLLHIPSSRIRGYILGVFEYTLLQTLIQTGKLPNLSLWL